MPKIRVLRSGVASMKLCRAGSKAAVVAALVIVVGACGGNPQDAQGTQGTHALVRPSSGATAWQDFVQASSTSGCPSPACSDILAQVQTGATTRTVPSDLTPSLQDAANDLLTPDGGNCSQLPMSGLDRAYQPCVFDAGAPPSAPMMILIGNSRAVMWSRALLALASQLGYRFGFVQHEGCSMPRVEHPTHTGSVSAAECKEWEDSAVNWVNQQNPAVVLVASGPDLSDQVSPAELASGYAATLKELQGPGRKLFVLGEVPRLSEDPPRCLAAHSSSALKCATPPSEATSPDELQAGVDAARQSGAGYVNLTPWLCTSDVCPAIVGHYLAYRDQVHLTTTFAEALVPVFQQAINIGHA